LYYPDCFLRHIAEGRRKKKEGRKPFGEAERLTRRKKEEGKRKKALRRS
jgi:hypothetical protein